MGECERNTGWMVTHCPLSCSSCGEDIKGDGDTIGTAHHITTQNLIVSVFIFHKYVESMIHMCVSLYRRRECMIR